ELACLQHCIGEIQRFESSRLILAGEQCCFRSLASCVGCVTFGDHGPSVVAQVTENEKVSTVKELVFERLNIPPNQQRLLYKGKALADEYRLSDYSIGPEAKLNLVVRPAGERNSGAVVHNSTSSHSSGSSGSGVWQSLSGVLAKHFTPADAAKVQEQIVKVLSAWQLFFFLLLVSWSSFSFLVFVFHGCVW
uniref:Ubiquitin-like domain-containing protein n=1 Tax=Electrophorus electricus TaxID=8005 RepID=A0A4W4DRK7_ELEEL